MAGLLCLASATLEGGGSSAGALLTALVLLSAVLSLDCALGLCVTRDGSAAVPPAREASVRCEAGARLWLLAASCSGSSRVTPTLRQVSCTDTTTLPKTSPASHSCGSGCASLRAACIARRLMGHGSVAHMARVLDKSIKSCFANRGWCIAHQRRESSCLSDSRWLEGHLQLRDQILQPVSLQGAASIFFNLCTWVAQQTVLQPLHQLPMEKSGLYAEIQVLLGALVLITFQRPYLNHNAVCDISVHVLCAGHKHCSQSPKG